MSVKIPADVEREDRVLAGLTARQLIILGAAGFVLFGVWQATRTFLPLPVFLAFAAPIGVATAAVAVGQRDGVGLDRLLVAAIRHRLSPRRRVYAPEGVSAAPAWADKRGSRGERAQAVDATPLELPVEGTTDAGVVDLGRDGLAAVAACSTVNFALRTPEEQEALVTAFGRFLHSLSGPAQILVRVQQLDLSTQIAQLRGQAPSLPHPALERAARGHASFLAALAADADLLHRQVLLVLRESTAPTVESSSTNPLTAAFGALRRSGPTRRVDHERQQAAERRLVQRLSEAAGLLAAAGITVTPLDPDQARAVLASACDPDSALGAAPDLAGPEEVITTAPDDSETSAGTAAPEEEEEEENDDDSRLATFRERYAR